MKPKRSLLLTANPKKKSQELVWGATITTHFFR